MHTRPAKTILVVAVAVALTTGIALFYFHNSASAAIGNLSIYRGSAQVTRGAATIPATSGTEIDLSDTITVPPDARVAIILKDGTEVRLDSGTRVTVSDIVYDGGKLSSAVIRLQSGDVWSHVSPLAAGGKFQVETPTVVATVRGTEFDVSYDGTASEVYVYSHGVWVALRSNPENAVELGEGNFISIRDASAGSDFAAGPHSSFMQNDWTIFNEGLSGNGAAPSTAPTGTGASGGAATGTPPVKTGPTNPKSAGATSTTTKNNGSAGAPSLSLSLSAQDGTTQQNQTDALTVVATYPDGTTANVTKQVSWIQSPVGNIIDAQGFLHASFVGPASITATLNGIKSNTISIMITPAGTQPSPSQAGPAISRIAVSCVQSAQQYATYYAATVQCTATGYYSDGSQKDITGSASWSVSGSAGGSIKAGTYQPAQKGPAAVTASLGGISGSTDIAVN